jgi:hypothetical protein
VTVPLHLSDDREATLSASYVTFTPDNWNVAQMVVVTGVDDDVVDGDRLYWIITAWAVSEDRRYHGINPRDVQLVNLDDDTLGLPGIVVDPTDGLTTSEDGGVAQFTIVLNAPPTADVTLGLSSSDASEGTVSPNSVTFTVDDWDEAQAVVVTGLDDDRPDGDITYTVITAWAVSLDRSYHGIDPENVRITNTDDDARAARRHHTRIARVAGRNALKHRALLSSRAIEVVSANAAVTDVAISRIGTTLRAVDRPTAEPLRADRLLRREKVEAAALDARRHSVDSLMAQTGPGRLRPVAVAQFWLWQGHSELSSGELELDLGEIAAEVSSADIKGDSRGAVLRNWL